MPAPLVSVIIPTFNRGHIVCKAIESVLKQTYKNIEVIVVDDGSTDDTQDKLAVYRGRIRLLYQENAGPSAARNRCVESANGEIVAFLDSDDLWLPTKLERQVNVLMRAGKSVSCCLCNTIARRIDGNERLYFDIASINPRYKEGVWTNVTDVLSTRFILFTQAIAIRRGVFLKLGGFDEELWIMEDHDLALRLSLEGPWAYIREPLVVNNCWSKDGLSSQAKENQVKLFQTVEKLYMKILSEDCLKDKKIRRRIERRVNIARFNSACASASGNHHFVASLFIRLSQYKIQLAEKVYRHSPWFPRMQDIPLNQLDS